MIIKNEIPILEFDTDTSAILNPNHRGLPICLPKRAVFAFLSDKIDDYAMSVSACKITEFESATKMYPIYEIEHKGERVCLCQAPVGAAAAAQIMDWLIAYGVEKIISAGSCGALEDIAENTFLVPCSSLRDEGTSYHYAPPSRWIDTDPEALAAIKAALEQHALSYREVRTWSTDGFFRETKEKTEYRKSEGCSVVEMECAALCACAKMRNARWGAILYAADTLANAEKYDERSWGKGAEAYALQLCLDAVILL